MSSSRPDVFLIVYAYVGLYPSISHDEGLKVLRTQYDKFINKTVPTEDIFKMAEFVLKILHLIQIFTNKYHGQQ